MGDIREEMKLREAEKEALKRKQGAGRPGSLS
jgi:hypothetical protein